MSGAGRDLMAKILVVDDDSNIRKAVQLALETNGHEVRTASSKEAGEAARRIPPGAGMA